MTEEVKPPATVTAMKPPVHWRPDMVARMILANADRFKWFWMVGETREGNLSIMDTEMPADAIAKVLRVVIQESTKKGAP